jgi:hypothetical protein
LHALSSQSCQSYRKAEEGDLGSALTVVALEEAIRLATFFLKIELLIITFKITWHIVF